MVCGLLHAPLHAADESDADTLAAGRIPTSAPRKCMGHCYDCIFRVRGRKRGRWIAFKRRREGFSIYVRPAQREGDCVAHGPLPERVVWGHLLFCHVHSSQTTSSSLHHPLTFSFSLLFHFSFFFVPVFDSDRAVPRQPNYSLEQPMTNVSAGAKRSWEGHHHSESDGHTHSPSHPHSNPLPHKRQRGREVGSGRWEEKRGKRESRDRREYRSRERERDRDRDREREQDKDRERDSRRVREHCRDRDRHDGREHRRRDDERRRTPATTDGPSSTVSNERPPPPQRADSDREEGE
jgi:hypothetical protein